MDGLLSKAQRECPFRYYAFRFRQLSASCRDSQGEREWQQLFAAGTAAFDRHASERGKRALCDKLVRDFPMTVKY